MRTQVIDRFTQEYGSTARRRVKVWAWAPRVDIGLVVDMEVPVSDSYAEVWTPHPGPAESIPANAVSYPANKRRHSGTYASPGLRQGMPALCFKIEYLAQLDDLVRFIRGLPPIRSAV